MQLETAIETGISRFLWRDIHVSPREADSGVKDLSERAIGTVHGRDAATGVVVS